MKKRNGLLKVLAGLGVLVVAGIGSGMMAEAGIGRGHDLLVLQCAFVAPVTYCLFKFIDRMWPASDGTEAGQNAA
jgi:hypothetical protein